MRDNINDRLEITGIEIVKIREIGDGGGCVYYDKTSSACKIYDQRPAQCAALACWDNSEFMRVYAEPKARRREIMQDRIVLGLMEEHDRRCDYGDLEKHVRRIEREGEKAVERIIEMLKFDYHLRPFISEKMEIEPGEMDFIFGRPLIETIIMFGLHVRRESDGSFYLTPKLPLP